MTVILEVFSLFFGIFFSKWPTNFFRVKYYHFQYLGGALDIAVHVRKKIMTIRGLNQKLSPKMGRGGKNGDFGTVSPPP